MAGARPAAAARTSRKTEVDPEIQQQLQDPKERKAAAAQLRQIASNLQRGLRRGQESDEVGALQEALNRYMGRPVLQRDRKFGPETQRILREAQAMLRRDQRAGDGQGIGGARAGRPTLEALANALESDAAPDERTADHFQRIRPQANVTVPMANDAPVADNARLRPTPPRQITEQRTNDPHVTAARPMRRDAPVDVANDVNARRLNQHLTPLQGERLTTAARQIAGDVAGSPEAQRAAYAANVLRAAPPSAVNALHDQLAPRGTEAGRLDAGAYQQMVRNLASSGALPRGLSTESLMAMNEAARTAAKAPFPHAGDIRAAGVTRLALAEANAGSRVDVNNGPAREQFNSDMRLAFGTIPPTGSATFDQELDRTIRGTLEPAELQRMQAAALKRLEGIEPPADAAQLPAFRDSLRQTINGLPANLDTEQVRNLRTLATEPRTAAQEVAPIDPHLAALRAAAPGRVPQVNEGLRTELTRIGALPEQTRDEARRLAMQRVAAAVRENGQVVPARVRDAFASMSQDDIRALWGQIGPAQGTPGSAAPDQRGRITPEGIQQLGLELARANAGNVVGANNPALDALPREVLQTIHDNLDTARQYTWSGNNYLPAAVATRAALLRAGANEPYKLDESGRPRLQSDMQFVFGSSDATTGLLRSRVHPEDPFHGSLPENVRRTLQGEMLTRLERQLGGQPNETLGRALQSIQLPSNGNAADKALRDRVEALRLAATPRPAAPTDQREMNGDALLQLIRREGNLSSLNAAQRIALGVHLGRAELPMPGTGQHPYDVNRVPGQQTMAPEVLSGIYSALAGANVSPDTGNAMARARLAMLRRGIRPEGAVEDDATFAFGNSADRAGMLNNVPGREGLEAAMRKAVLDRLEEQAAPLTAAGATPSEDDRAAVTGPIATIRRAAPNLAATDAASATRLAALERQLTPASRTAPGPAVSEENARLVTAAQGLRGDQARQDATQRLAQLKAQDRAQYDATLKAIADGLRPPEGQETDQQARERRDRLNHLMVSSDAVAGDLHAAINERLLAGTQERRQADLANLGLAYHLARRGVVQEGRPTLGSIPVPVSNDVGNALLARAMRPDAVANEVSAALRFRYERSQRTDPADLAANAAFAFDRPATIPGTDPPQQQPTLRELFEKVRPQLQAQYEAERLAGRPAETYEQSLAAESQYFQQMAAGQINRVIDGRDANRRELLEQVRADLAPRAGDERPVAPGDSTAVARQAVLSAVDSALAQTPARGTTQGALDANALAALRRTRDTARDDNARNNYARALGDAVTALTGTDRRIDPERFRALYAGNADVARDVFALLPGEQQVGLRTAMPQHNLGAPRGAPTDRTFRAAVGSPDVGATDNVQPWLAAARRIAQRGTPDDADAAALRQGVEPLEGDQRRQAMAALAAQVREAANQRRGQVAGALVSSLRGQHASELYGSINPTLTDPERRAMAHTAAAAAARLPNDVLDSLQQTAREHAIKAGSPVIDRNAAAALRAEQISRRAGEPVDLRNQQQRDALLADIKFLRGEVDGPIGERLSEQDRRGLFRSIGERLEKQEQTPPAELTGDAYRGHLRDVLGLMGENDYSAQLGARLTARPEPPQNIETLAGEVLRDPKRVDRLREMFGRMPPADIQALWGRIGNADSTVNRTQRLEADEVARLGVGLVGANTNVGARDPQLERLPPAVLNDINRSLTRYAGIHADQENTRAAATMRAAAIRAAAGQPYDLSDQGREQLRHDLAAAFGRTPTTILGATIRGDNPVHAELPATVREELQRNILDRLKPQVGEQANPAVAAELAGLPRPDGEVGQRLAELTEYAHGRSPHEAATEAALRSVRDSWRQASGLDARRIANLNEELAKLDGPARERALQRIAEEARTGVRPHHMARDILNTLTPADAARFWEHIRPPRAGEQQGNRYTDDQLSALGVHLGRGAAQPGGEHPPLANLPTEALRAIDASMARGLATATDRNSMNAAATVRAAVLRNEIREQAGADWRKPENAARIRELLGRVGAGRADGNYDERVAAAMQDTVRNQLRSAILKPLVDSQMPDQRRAASLKSYQDGLRAVFGDQPVPPELQERLAVRPTPFEQTAREGLARITNPEQAAAWAREFEAWRSQGADGVADYEGLRNTIANQLSPRADESAAQATQRRAMVGHFAGGNSELGRAVRDTVDANRVAMATERSKQAPSARLDFADHHLHELIDAMSRVNLGSASDDTRRAALHLMSERIQRNKPDDLAANVAFAFGTAHPGQPTLAALTRQPAEAQRLQTQVGQQLVTLATAAKSDADAKRRLEVAMRQLPQGSPLHRQIEQILRPRPLSSYSRGNIARLPANPLISSYKGPERQYGSERARELLLRVAEDFHRETGYTLRVGDLSGPNGSGLDDHRAGHTGGNQIDIDIVFRGRTVAEPNRNGPRAKYTWTGDQPYDRDATRQLVDIIRRHAPGVTIFNMDPVLIREGRVRWLDQHDNHMHLQGF